MPEICKYYLGKGLCGFWARVPDSVLDAPGFDEGKLAVGTLAMPNGKENLVVCTPAIPVESGNLATIAQEQMKSNCIGMSV